MNCTKLIIAFIFLFNPTINVIDVLPDFIGWLLIFDAVKYVRHISLQMESADLGVTRMAWLSLTSFLCIFLTPQIDKTMLLTIMFIVNTLKLVWGIPTFKALFSGLNELSGLYNGKSIYKPVGRTCGEGITTVEKYTMVFLVSTSVISIIPDFFELSAHSPVILSEGQRALYTFTGLFYVISFIITLIIGIIWLSVILPFIARLSKETEFWTNVKNTYKIKVVNTGKHRAIELLSALFLISISGMFLIPVMFDDMNIVPRFFMPLIIFIATHKISKSGYNCRFLKIFTALSLMLSTIAYIMRWVFVVKYTYYSLERSFDSIDFFNITLYLMIAELLFFILTYLLLIKTVYKIVNNDAIKEAVFANDSKTAEYTQSEKRVYRSRISVSFVLFIFACSLNVFSFIICKEIPQSWILVSLAGILWFVHSYSLYSKIRTSVEMKHL